MVQCHGIRNLNHDRQGCADLPTNCRSSVPCHCHGRAVSAYAEELTCSLLKCRIRLTWSAILGTQWESTAWKAITSVFIWPTVKRMPDLWSFLSAPATSGCSFRSNANSDDSFSSCLFRKTITMHRSHIFSLRFGVALLLSVVLVAIAHGADALSTPTLVRSARNGPWSVPTTWEGGKLPAAGSRVLIRSGHAVVYDLDSDQALRVLQVAGSLSFAPDRDTRLDVGLLKIQSGEEVSESGFDCDAHLPAPDASKPVPALEIGSPDHPVEPNHTALVRLVYFEGMNRESCPAIVCCGGRMDFHGTPMSRTWVKLGKTVQEGDRTVTLAEAVTGPARYPCRHTRSPTLPQKEVRLPPPQTRFKKLSSPQKSERNTSWMCQYRCRWSTPAHSRSITK